MHENDWLYFIVTLPYVLFLALASGLANFIMRLNQATSPQPIKTLFLRLSGELFLSGLAGLLTFLLCKEWQLSANYTAVMVAISGSFSSLSQEGLGKIFSS